MISKNKSSHFFKVTVFFVLFIISQKLYANPLNQNSIYSQSVYHPLVSSAYNIKPRTLSAYFLYIPDAIKNSDVRECNIRVIVRAKSDTSAPGLSMAITGNYILYGFSQIPRLGFHKSLNVTRQSSQHCNDVLPQFGVTYGDLFGYNNINVSDYKAWRGGAAGVCLQIFVNEVDLGTTCSTDVAEIPTLPSCNVSLPLSISHGDVDTNNINGHVANINGNITCTGDMNATFQFIPQNEIDLSLGVKSKLDVCLSGKCMSNNLIQAKIQKNTNLTFSVNSTLSAMGNPEPGSRIGNAILSIVIN